jgi:hypothetical protein
MSGFGEYGLLIYTLGVVAAILFSSFQTRIAIKGAQRGDKSFRADIFMKIADKWSAIYETRNTVLNAEPTTLEQLEAKYTNYRPFLASAEWKGIREVCNFFEFLGVVLHEGFIDKGPLFVLVTVQDKEGKMSRNLKPYIQYLRKHYRPDIYIFYDHLFEQYQKHKGAPFVPSGLNQREFDPPGPESSQRFARAWRILPWAQARA